MYLGQPPLLEYFDYERCRTIRFKSKHEWMWAQHFQDARLDWEYEPLTFLSPDKTTKDRRLTYTPDFGLRLNRISIEIKTYNEKHVRNRLDFCLQPLILIFGLPNPLKHDAHVYIPGIARSTRYRTWSEAFAVAQQAL